MNMPTMTMTSFFAANTNKMNAVLKTKTVVRMNKKDVATKQIANPHGTVYKIQRVQVELNGDYEKNVNQSRAVEEKSQDFEKGELKWGQHKFGKAIIENDGKLYLQTTELGKIGDVEYVDENGNPVDYASIKPFMPVYKPSAKQGLEDEVKIRTFKYESVLEIIIKTDTLVLKLVQ